jgi:ribonuclease HI
MKKPKPKEIIIYTDGACDPNPGPGGWAALIIYPDHKQEISGNEVVSTNNRMELLAAINALRTVPKSSDIRLFTDSQYLKLGVEEWLPNWISMGWKRKGGKLANNELWQQLNQEVEKHQVEWFWVRGHTGDPNNERVNYLAQRAIKNR